MSGKRFGHETIVGVANVESSSVSFSILQINGATGASVLVHSYAELPLEERTSGQHLFALKQRLSDITKAALLEYAAKSRRSVKTIYVIVHAPWAGGSVINAAIHFQKEEHVTSKLISECATQALSQAHSENVLDVRQLRIMLNGYKTAQPEGKYAHMIEVAGLRSTCEPKVKDELVAALQAAQPGASVIVHSGAWSVVESLPLSSPELHNLVCLHISGEGTEIIVVRGGIVSGYSYVPEGLRTIFARVFPGLHPDEARAAARRMSRGEASEGAALGTQEAFLKAEPALAAAYGEGFAKISAQTRLPNAMLLIVDTDIAAWVQKFFERLDFSQFTITAQPFLVRILSAKELGSLGPTSKEADNVDVAIAASHVVRELAAA